MVQAGESCEYMYDTNGNITKASRNGVETTYVYDALSQLVHVNCSHENHTETFAYDRGGNLLSRRVYAFTKGDLPDNALLETVYCYDDADWKDKLTAFDGKPITYDEIGNPLNDGTWTYTWKHGRQLAKMEKSGEAVQYAYNRDKLRMRKESGSGGVTTHLLSSSL